MLGKLLALFILVPLVELIILIEIGKIIGTLNTIGLVIVTGFIGALLAKFEGLRVWTQLQAELLQGKIPTDKMIDGVMILAGGVMLLTPGILTDILGLSLIIPFFRKPFREMLKKKFVKKTRSQVEVITIDPVDPARGGQARRRG